MSNHAPSELIKTVLSLNFVKGGGYTTNSITRKDSLKLESDKN